MSEIALNVVDPPRTGEESTELLHAYKLDGRAPDNRDAESTGSSKGSYGSTADVENSADAAKRSERLNLVMVWLITGIQAAVLGVNYALSILVDPVQRDHPNWNHKAPVIAQSIMVCVSGVSCGFIGRLLRSMGPRKSGLVGAAFVTVGFLLVGIGLASDQEWLFYLAWLLVGAGLGIANMNTITYITTWNPARRGFAGGYFGTTLGAGTIAWTQAFPNLPWRPHFIYFGIAVVMFAGLAPTSLFMRAVPAPSTAVKPTLEPFLVPYKRMLGRPTFWALLVAFWCSLTAGWGFVTQFPQVFQSLTKDSLHAANTLTTYIVALYTLSRLFWGAVSDKIGRKHAYFLYLLGQAVSYAILPTVAKHSVAGGVFVFFVAVSLLRTLLTFSGLRTGQQR
jgi:MFS transporter, OFA family, oxalate/formate antiporter